ncbi:MAG: hypothetical protein HZB22_06465 [Deltaproteobacteria bacterium]|nr:hypothetical protein [Deltaproteobacteria bacterium]
MGINSGTKGLLVIAASALLAFTGCGGEKKVQESGTTQGLSANAGAPASQPQQQPAPQGEQAGLPAGHAPIEKSMEAASGSTAPAGALPSGHPTAAGGGNEGGKGAKAQRELSISPEVKARWSEAKLEVTDSGSKTKESITIKVGSTENLKKKGFKLKVEALVPDYSISDNRIESRSNDPRNPAVLVELFDGDKSVAKGWVFKNFPDFNSYRDDRVGVLLVAPGPEKK